MSLIGTAIRKEFNPRHVGIVEFAESEEFCGKQLYPRQRVLLKLIFLEEMEGWEEDILTDWINGGRDGDIVISPRIRERRDWCRSMGYQHFHETVLVGGRGSAKGYVSGLAGAYKIWKTQQLPDPGAHYGIDPDKEIYFLCVAAALGQAKALQFADLVSSATRCKDLQPHLGKVLEEGFSIHTEADIRYIEQLKKNGVNVGRDWSKLRAKPLAANADTIRGHTSLFLIFDEMAFFQPGESASTADACYKAAEPTLARFGKDAMLFCNSSPYSEVGMFYERFELAMKVDNVGDPLMPMMFTLQYPSWEMYRGYQQDPKRRFKRAIMVSPDWPDSELNPDDRINKMQEQKKEEANPESYRVERRAQWAAVVDAYLNPLNVDRAFMQTFMGREMRMTTEGSYVFAPFKAHCDPSSTTAGFGFAMGHVEEFPDPSFPDGMARHVVFDIVKRWNPGDFPGHTINYLKVQEDLEKYAELYLPDEITFDQFNSVGLIQGMRRNLAMKSINGVRVFDVTATKAVNWQRWEAFKTAINLGLVHVPPDCPDADWAKLELKFLQEKNGRVDKQDIGAVQTKDIADCIAEVTYKFIGTFLENYMIQTLNTTSILPGAQGGYPMGGRGEHGPMNPQAGFDQFYAKRPGMGGNAAARGIRSDRRR